MKSGFLRNGAQLNEFLFKTETVNLSMCNANFVLGVLEVVVCVLTLNSLQTFIKRLTQLI